MKNIEEQLFMNSMRKIILITECKPQQHFNWFNLLSLGGLFSLGTLSNSKEPENSI